MRRPVIEVIDDEMARVLAEKTGAERLEIAFGMYESAREMLSSHLHSRFPDWDAERIEREVVRRFSHATE